MSSTAYTIAAARTALHTPTSLRAVTGKTAEVRELNAVVDATAAEAMKLLGLSQAALSVERLRFQGDVLSKPRRAERHFAKTYIVP